MLDLTPINRRYFLLIYDSDCGPCTRFKRIIEFLDTHDRFRYESLVRSDKLGLLNSIPMAERHRSFHLISPEGRVSSGALAIPALLCQLPLGGIASTLVTKAPGGIRLVGLVYSTFSRLHEGSSCNYSHRYSAGGGSSKVVLEGQEPAGGSKREVDLGKKSLFTWRRANASILASSESIQSPFL
ncbi:MAG TPA: DCC1-like thiol-disulfide oxidoreductase family protein [Nitrososphaerales archaeon]|nr:DCC1-like thiol-disulfide oxidoreductase family protein [Nitrososphaerales archaeon]